MVTAIDYMATFIAVLALTMLALPVVVYALRGVFPGVSRGINEMWEEHDDRILLYVIAVAAAWCEIRWKALNARHK